MFQHLNQIHPHPPGSPYPARSSASEGGRAPHSCAGWPRRDDAPGPGSTTALQPPGPTARTQRVGGVGEWGGGGVDGKPEVSGPACAAGRGVYGGGLLVCVCVC